ncbi:hypothetical protein ADIMK_0646 [Marinobacterium lacunae]|uniref:Uncharacterized protein n=1 Tax=Marinobacterium lacunae TaxID=1232683 RepID=A0A081G2D9_9GAMM|nr:hypothetical protein [Marinobacterium lacunae]KEA64944.1 hypothetical protein ADIMK_0646 [Marinobacterium lacunae]MBR9882273.1 hypothetical protein [Oceanospirillales bacterium]
MRKLAIGFVFLVLLPALVIAGGYGFYWYQVKRYADQLVEQAAPFARVEYGAIYADPRGEVGLDGVSITLNQDGTRIPVESIRVRSQDPLFFFDPQGRIESGDLPLQLGFVVKQVEVDLSSKLVKTLAEQAAAAEALSPGVVSPDALGCGALTRIDVEALGKMGYKRMAMDMAVSMALEPHNRRIRLNADTDLSGFGQSSVALELSVTGDNYAPAQILAANPRLRRIEASYQDAGYNARRNKFCAKESGVEVDQYLAEHERLMREWLLTQGVDLPELLWDLYNGMNKPRGRATITVEPPGGLGAEVMASLGSPTQLVDRLNIGVSLNDKRLAIDSIDWNSVMVEPKVASAPRVVERESAVADVVAAAEASAAEAVVAEVEESAAESAMSDEDDILRGLPKREPKPEPKQYRSISLTQLADAQGLPVRVRTDLGNRFEGRIVDARNGTLKIEQRVDRGVIVYPLEFDQISSVEVYR